MSPPVETIAMAILGGLAVILGGFLVIVRGSGEGKRPLARTRASPSGDHAVAAHASDLVVRGDLEVSGNMTLPARLRVEGGLLLSEAVSLDSHMEVFGDVVLRDRARITKPIIVHGALRLGRDASVVAARVTGDAFLDAGSRVEGALQCSTLYLNETDRAPPAATLATLRMENDATV